MHQIDKKLLEILACPKCKQPVILQPDSLLCTSGTCRLAYPVRDDIPVMLISEAKTVSAAEHEKAMQGGKARA